MAVRLLGELLIKKGFITQEQLNAVLKKSPETEEMLGRMLIKMGYLKEEQLFQILAEQFNLSFYPRLKEIEISPQTVKAVPVKFVQRYKFMPLSIKEKVLTIAVYNPMDVWLAEDIKLNLGYGVQKVLSTYTEIEQAIHKYYGVVADTVDRILTEKKDEKTAFMAKEEGIEEIEKSAEEASVIKLVNQVLSEAIRMRATDIHIEPYQNKIHLRYRIDGVLRDIKVPEDIYYIQPAIVSRIKIMSHLDVVEHRIPQDGRAKVRLQEGQEADLRVSIIPGYFGENVVIRILPTQILLDLSKIGFSPDDLQKIEKIMQKLHGIILLTGPTGSGKTTTLYACLSRLNKPQVKIISIEDPVEYALEGITQIQINPKVGLTFANALRSILRHDPDVMMIGEIRDVETADLAIRAALTGHLVFSTLHTNDAPSGIARLLDMGIEPFLLASSVEVLIAQRLVRLLCNSCQGKGCDGCNETGFKGRSAIFEILFINEQIRQMIISRKSASEIKEKAKELGFMSLWQAGMEKVKTGITTTEEVLRVVEPEGDEEFKVTAEEKVVTTLDTRKESKIERRLFRRLNVELPIECALLEDKKAGIRPFTYSARTKNISAGGLLFETDKSFPVGSIVNIKIQFPFKKEDIICRALILRTEKQRDDRSYKVAVCFMDIKDSEMEQINQYVHQELARTR